jgi:hypothetical protein
VTLSNSSLTLTILAGNSLSASSNLMLTSGTLNTEADFPTVSGTITIAGGTVGYTGAGDQTVAALAYNDLTISGGGTKTLAGNITIAGNLTISGGTLDLGTSAANRTSTGGTLSLPSGATLLLGGSGGGISGSNFPNNYTTVTLSGSVEFNGAGAQTIPAFSYNNLTSSSNGARTLASSGTVGVAGTFTAGTNSYTVTGSTMDYNGAGAQSVAATTYYNLTFSNAGTKTFATGTTQVAGNFTISGAAAGDATTNSTTIEYNGTSPQNFAAVTYYNLNTSGTGAKDAAQDVTINNSFNNAATTSMGLFTLSIGGTKTNSGTMQFAGATNGVPFSSGTVEYNGTIAQTITAGTYSTLVLSNTGAKTMNSAITVNSYMLVNSTSTLTVDVAGVLTVNGNLDNDGIITNNGTITVQ